MAERPSVLGITIDSESTKDIDDAIWVEEKDDVVRVLVSIADAASKVQQNSALDNQARAAVETKYFADGNRPMLPRRLAENAISLLPNQPRNTVSVAFTFSKTDPTPKLERIFLSRLTSKGKVNYAKIPAILKTPSDPMHKLLQLASTLSFRMLSHRRAKGAMALYDLNNGWVTTEDGRIRKLANKDAVVGQIIIQEMMIATNSLVATFAKENQIPILFRNHRARPSALPRDQLLKELIEAFADPKDQEALQRSVHTSLEKAVYEAFPDGHYGLAIPAYTHFTSPIRRYADLVVHRQIRGFLRGDPLPYSAEDLAVVASHINERLKEQEDEISKRMKQMHETKAASLDSRRIITLNAKDFERVVKVWARSANVLPEEIKAAFLHRLADNRVPSVCFMSALTEAFPNLGWEEVHAAIIKHLANHLEEATVVLNLASQAHGWGQPQFDTSRSGTDNAPIFQARIQMEDREGMRSTQEDAFGPTIKDAKHKAALFWLSDLVKQPHPSFQTVAGSALPKSAIPVPSPSEGDAISLLQEYSSKKRDNGPIYNFETQGPGHQLTITCTCSYSGITRRGTGQRKQDAKRAAAQAVLESLKP